MNSGGRGCSEPISATALQPGGQRETLTQKERERERERKEREREREETPNPCDTPAC